MNILFDDGGLAQHVCPHHKFTAISTASRRLSTEIASKHEAWSAD